MKLFVWLSTYPVTDNYHDGGGLMVCEEDLDSARRRWDTERGRRFKDAVTPDPDLVFDLAGPQEPSCYVFPDAGCC